MSQHEHPSSSPRNPHSPGRSSAQDPTLGHYHQLMQINAASHLIRVARQVGLLDQLRDSQRTLEQLCGARDLDRQTTSLLLDALVGIGIVEKYADDFALARVAHLLCQYDEDLGDARWMRLADRLRGAVGQDTPDSRQSYFDSLAATQWIHTPAAMDAAEMLDIGGENEVPGVRILDLGCGSAVWSCAMAHRDAEATITAVDNAAAIEAATSTADSIGLGDRFQTIAADPMRAELPSAEFDLVLIAQRLSCLEQPEADELLERAWDAARPGGRLVVIDPVRGSGKPPFSECVEALRVQIDTPGHVRSIDEIQGLLRGRGLLHVQFAFLPASKVNLGIAVGEKPVERWSLDVGH